MYCNYINCMFFGFIKIRICILVSIGGLLTHLTHAGRICSSVGHVWLRRKPTWYLAVHIMMAFVRIKVRLWFFNFVTLKTWPTSVQFVSAKPNKKKIILNVGQKKYLCEDQSLPIYYGFKIMDRCENFVGHVWLRRQPTWHLAVHIMMAFVRITVRLWLF